MIWYFWNEAKERWLTFDMRRRDAERVSEEDFETGVMLELKDKVGLVGEEVEIEDSEDDMVV